VGPHGCWPPDQQVDQRTKEVQVQWGVKRRHEKIRVVVDILFFIESSGLKKSNLPPKCVHRRSRTLIGGADYFFSREL